MRRVQKAQALFKKRLNTQEMPITKSVQRKERNWR